MNIFLKSLDCCLNIFHSISTIVILLCCLGFVTNAQESVSLGAYAFQDGKYTIQTNAPKHTGVYHKVQIISVGTFDKNDPDLQTAIKLGQLSTEYIMQRDVYRLLIGEYLNLTDAESLLQKLKSAGFRDAFIVKYKHGIRVKM